MFQGLKFQRTSRAVPRLPTDETQARAPLASSYWGVSEVVGEKFPSKKYFEDNKPNKPKEQLHEVWVHE